MGYIMKKLYEIYSEITLIEGKQVGTVYHWTTMAMLFKILDTNILKGYTATKRIRGITVSTTRDKNFIKNRGNGILVISGGEVGIVLDGNKLANTYQVMPYDDSMDSSGEIDYDDKQAFGDEQEELWYGSRLVRDGGIKNISKYILKLIITKRFLTRLINDYKYMLPDYFDWTDITSSQQKLNDIKEKIQVKYNLEIEIQK